MDRSQALAALGLAHDVRDHAVLRAAWRARLREVHPDLNPADTAAESVRVVNEAFRFLVSPSAEVSPPPSGKAPRGGKAPRSAAPPRRPRPTAPPRTLRTRMADPTTVLVEASRPEALAAVIEAAHRLGEVSYLDPSAGLVEAVVEFVEAPTSSVVMSLQGRGAEVEVFCTVEPLSGGDSPPADAVAALVARTIAAIPVSDLAI